MVEGARLESVYTAKPYRGFEPLPLRQPDRQAVPYCARLYRLIGGESCGALGLLDSLDWSKSI